MHKIDDDYLHLFYDYETVSLDLDNLMDEYEELNQATIEHLYKKHQPALRYEGVDVMDVIKDRKEEKILLNTSCTQPYCC